MEIRDGGIGFNPADISETAGGLRTIRERTQILGGSYKLESAPGKGTRLTVKLPLKS
jgi:signal transduction histidine kinase